MRFGASAENGKACPFRGPISRGGLRPSPQNNSPVSPSSSLVLDGVRSFFLNLHDCSVYTTSSLQIPYRHCCPIVFSVARHTVVSSVGFHHWGIRRLILHRMSGRPLKSRLFVSNSPLSSVRSSCGVRPIELFRTTAPQAKARAAGCRGQDDE